MTSDEILLRAAGILEQHNQQGQEKLTAGAIEMIGLLTAGTTTENIHELAPHIEYVSIVGHLDTAVAARLQERDAQVLLWLYRRTLNAG